MEAKKAWKTTEFWLSVSGIVLALIMMSGLVRPGTSFDKVIGLIVGVMTHLGYSFSRSLEKMRTPADKPGYKTTEFWGTAILSSLGVLMASGAVENNEAEQFVGALAAGLSTMGYAPLRGMVKKGVAPLLLLVLVSGCCLSGVADTRAELATYEAIAPEYREYVAKDPELEEDQKASRLETLRSWKERIDAR